MNRFEMEFNPSQELNEYLQERTTFVCREIKYAKLLTDISSKDIFLSSVRAYTNALSEVLNYIKNQEKDLFQTVTTKEQYWEDLRTIEAWHSGMSELIHHLVTAILQRKKKAVGRFVAPLPRIRYFPLSEIHLEYALTVRAIEVLSAECHQKLGKFFSPIQCQTPLLNLAGGQETALAFPPVPTFSTNKGKFRLDLQRHLNLCRITAPRFSPISIRHIGGLSHEHFHHVLFLADFFGYYLKKIDENTSLTAEQRKVQTRDLIRKFGDYISQLSVIRFRLGEEMNSWAESKKIPREPNKRNHDHEERKNIVKAHVNELLADLAGVLLAGPAYLFPFITIYQDNPQSEVDLLDKKRAQERKEAEGKKEDETEGVSTHPPSLVRIRFQIKILKEELGFEKFGALFEEKIEEPWDNVSKSYSLIKSYFEDWVTSESAWSLFQDCKKLIHKSIRSRRFDPYIAKPPRKKSKKGKSEEEWYAYWKSLVTQITEESNLCHRDMQMKGIQASDILNAIWIKKQDGQFKEKEKQRMAWRLCLENIGKIF